MTSTPETPELAGQVSDAVSGNWVDTRAPKALRPYLRLSRADRPIGTWLLFIPCLWGVLLAAAATGWRALDIWIILGCGMGAWLMRGAGCTWNDITDKDLDAQVERTRSRPIPSGQVTMKQAYTWMGLQAAFAGWILITFNGATIILGLLALIPVAIYPFAKRFTWWPQLFLGIAFNWGALLAWTAHTGSVGLPAVLLYLAGIAWTIFYDTIYAHQDREDDALIGIKSTARLFGDNTVMILRFFQMATVILLTAAIVAAMLSQASFFTMMIGVLGAWAAGWHMAWLLSRLDTENPDVCLTLFRSCRDTGLIPVLFLAVALML
ncbi:4-hydroxybenzoate polyprenyltransferase [Actibacterium atlanticum]|uniref:4-hydroxybenzoate octaprenyltransferase n=1 Tax=Actibacterium atlanticum TaxID=1461693 RepID=A0A058ZHW7_9RHOB|nr:4-hydroxybenzoate octaprenyltransferase [Actibacterium atlanticum]KCV80820.1 4-hydroxybenzoate polyprenyltransferase [Actibacterium atlanticum]